MKKRQWYKYEKKNIQVIGCDLYQLSHLMRRTALEQYAHDITCKTIIEWKTTLSQTLIFLYVNKPIRWLSDYQNSCQSWPRLTNKWLRKTVTHWRKRNKPGTLTGWTGGPFESPASGSFCPDTLQTCLRVLSLSLSQHLKLYQNQKIQ